MSKRPASRHLAAIIPTPPAGRVRCPHAGCPAVREFEAEMDQHALEPHPRAAETPEAKAVDHE